MVTQMPQSGYKQTEVGVIPEDWEVQNIIDNSTLKARIGWQGLTTTEYLSSGKFCLVTGTDFNNGKIDWDNCVYVDEKRYSQDRNIQLKIEDILVTKDGTIGKIAYIKTLPLPATLNSGVFVIRPKEKAYFPLFFFYVLSSDYFSKFLSKLQAGSTINHLYQKDFGSFNFIVPEYSEQEKIAKILSDIDDLIVSLDTLIEKKKNMKQGAMQELLTGKKRLPGFKGELVMRRLEEIAGINMGQSPDSNYYNEKGEGIPLIQGNADIEGRRSIQRIWTTQITKSCDENDIILTVRAPVGVVGIATNYSCIGRGVCSLKPKGVDRLYLYHLLIYNETGWKKLEQGSTFTSANSTQIDEFELYVSEFKEEQIAIANVLSDMDSEIEKLEQRRNKYRQLRIGTMQQLLTGRIRLKWKT